MAGDGFVGWLKTLNFFRVQARDRKILITTGATEIIGVFNQIDNRN